MRSSTVRGSMSACAGRRHGAAKRRDAAATQLLQRLTVRSGQVRLCLPTVDNEWGAHAAGQSDGRHDQSADAAQKSTKSSALDLSKVYYIARCRAS